METMNAGDMWKFEEPGQLAVVVQVEDVDDTHVRCRSATDGTPLMWAIETFRQFGVSIEPGSPGGSFTCTCRHPPSMHSKDVAKPSCSGLRCQCAGYHNHRQDMPPPAP
jgi:hypothetical protein